MSAFGGQSRRCQTRTYMNKAHFGKTNPKFLNHFKTDLLVSASKSQVRELEINLYSAPLKRVVKSSNAANGSAEEETAF